MKVEVYYNLHKGCWSVRYKGIVVLHCTRVDLVDVSFHVGQAGKDKVREEGRKNVHATVRGTLTNWESGTVLKCDTGIELFNERGRNAVFPVLGRPEVTYNPYLYDSFVLKATPEVAVDKARAVTMQRKRVYLGSVPPPYNEDMKGVAI